MTIKDIERETGMSRANIRFYEAQGLITPNRGGNGYREYLEEDMKTLLRIQLLRRLQISIEDIRKIISGEMELPSVLEAQINQFGVEISTLEKSRNLCQIMVTDKVTFENLDPVKYLEYMPEQTADARCLEEMPDIKPIPFRRFFARMLDLFVYNVIWDSILLMVFHSNILIRGRIFGIFDLIMGFVLMVIIKPVLLIITGTTLGKWIMGIHLQGVGRSKPSYLDTLDRTCEVIWYGMGFIIPIYNIYRLGKSYSICKDGIYLEWETDTELVSRRNHFWRPVVYLLVSIFFIVGLILETLFSFRPNNRGDLTVAQFAENYNEMSKFMFHESTVFLDQEGNWKLADGDIINNIDGSLGVEKNPELHFTLKDEKLVKISFTKSYTGKELLLSSYEREMELMVMAFVWANKDFSIYSDKWFQNLATISKHQYRSFQFETAGVHVTCNVTSEGYIGMDGTSMPAMNEDAKNHSYTILFTMEQK